MTENENNEHPSFSLGRKFGVAMGVLVACLSVLAIVVMVNYLAARHFYRLDCSTNQRWQLSPRTLRIIEMITNQVDAVVYYSRNANLYKESTDLLTEYAAKNHFLKLKLVDPESQPVEANIIKAKYNLAALNQQNVVIFDNNGKARVINQSELFDYELEPVQNSTEREFRKRTKSFRGEQQFTSALVAVLSSRSLKAYFLTGHGELNPASNDEKTGYSKFANILLENNFKADFLSLLGSSEVPSDCSLLVIPGPEASLSQDEVSKIERYLNQGGRLLVMFSYRSFGKRTGLEDILAGWGVSVRDNYVLEPGQSTTPGYDLICGITENEQHPIMRPLYQQRLQLVLPRLVTALRANPRAAEVLKVDELLHTTPQGMLVNAGPDHFPDINTVRDRRGSYSLMVAVEKGAVPGVKAERGSTRIVVTSDALFLNNDMIEAGANRAFASHAINWLVDQSFLLAGMGSREVREYRLNLTQSQMMTVRLLLLGALPSGALFFGLLVWFKRRN